MAGDDLLPELPEDAIVRILSFIKKEEDEVEACYLSKTWLHAWQTSLASHIIFDEYLYKTKFLDRNDFYDNVILSLRRYKEENLSIEKLGVKFSTLPDDNAWIQLVIKTRVKQLSVFASNPLSVLPPMIFEVESLVSLSVDFLTLKVPESISIKFCNLKYLNLLIVTLNEQNLGRIFSACREIETLKIWRCDGFQNLMVSNLPKLEHFLIHGIPKKEITTQKPSVQIEAPSLKKLELHEVNFPAWYEDECVLRSEFRLLEHSVIHGIPKKEITTQFGHFLIHGIPKKEITTQKPSVQIEAPSLKKLELHEVNFPAWYEDECVLRSEFRLLEHSVIHRTCEEPECEDAVLER